MDTVAPILHSLNLAQQQVVCAPCENLLVLAGAGSGKTRVLVHRVAWLISQRMASANSILAVTFTNKAAGEMRARLESMLGRESYGMWVGTFHGLAHKLLRLHWKEAALPQNFQVIDSYDQLQLIKKIVKTSGINEDRFEPKKIQGFINRKKDEGLRVQLSAFDNLYDKIMLDIYQQYEQICQQSGLVDFAELLLKSYELLNTQSDLLLHYQSRFTHVLVDEFQDTNAIQYRWLSLLGQKAKSVMAVGDDDQSIYGWRGAKIENIQRFEREFSQVSLIRLEQNYRSTSTILSAANALIANNSDRLGKTLWTDGEQGDRIALYAAFNEEDEALFIVREIRSLINQGKRLNEIGILYRSNAQSRVLEEAFMRSGIAYTIYGGLRFFERSEIKDALAYLRLAVNIRDNASFERVINMPPRGIGERTLEKLEAIAIENQCSYWEAAKEAVGMKLMSPRASSALAEFIKIIEELSVFVVDPSLTRLMQGVIHKTGLLEFFKEQQNGRAENRVENLEELINAANDFELEYASEEKDSPLAAFLAYTALEGGERHHRQGENAVQLMTLHSAKGLEFPVVFMSGLEEGLFPHHFSCESVQALEEERRLCYVGITRAREKLYFAYAERRRIFGRDEERRPSRFIQEIPKHLLSSEHRKINIRILSRDYAEDIQSLGLGPRVLHPKFGEGTVLDQEGSGERARVHVKFDVYGNKWLALAYAQLETL